MGTVTDEMVASKTPEELRAIACALIDKPYTPDYAKGFANGVKSLLYGMHAAGLISFKQSQTIYIQIVDSNKIAEAGALLSALDDDINAMQHSVRVGLTERAGGTPQ